MSIESSLLVHENKYGRMLNINGGVITQYISQEGTMANDISSDSDNEIIGARVKLFGHEQPIHQLLGGGKGNLIEFIFIVFLLNELEQLYKLCKTVLTISM